MLKQFRVPDDVAIRVESGIMRQVVDEVFQTLGMSAEDSQRSVDCLLYADERGIDSHGVSNMFRIYVKGLKEGEFNPKPKLKIIRDSKAAATIDSDRGLGLTIGPQAMEIAIEKARQCGVGTVVANNGKHYGAAAYHAQLALEHDMIGWSMTVGGPKMVPTFGAEGRVGVNPMAIAVPAGVEPPFIFDASMTGVAGNKIRLAKRLGENVLPGWIADHDGTPIMDEREVPERESEGVSGGVDLPLMLPLGGTREIGSHKGYSLAVMIDILAGILPGSGPAMNRHNGVGHHFTVFDVSAFTDVNDFKSEMDSYLRALRETPPAPGHDRVFYAGLEEHEEEIDRRERGIAYHPEVIEWIRKTTGELGLPDRFS